jgi:hypothetical protein
MASIEIMQKTYCAVVHYVALLGHMQKLTIMLVNQLLYGLCFTLTDHDCYLFWKEKWENDFTFLPNKHN